MEATRQLHAGRYERTLNRLDYLAGYRIRSVITPKGTHWLKVPKARSTPLRFSVFDRYQRLWKLVNQMLCEIFLVGCSTRPTGEVLELLLGARVSPQTVRKRQAGENTLARICAQHLTLPAQRPQEAHHLRVGVHR